MNAIQSYKDNRILILLVMMTVENQPAETVFSTEGEWFLGVSKNKRLLHIQQ